MKTFIQCFIALVLLLTQTALAQTRLSDPIPNNPEVKTGILPNGLKYYIRHNKKPENKVELRLLVNAGAVLEDDDQQGLAHFMEHMNFNGLKNFPENEIIHYLQSIGVAFGNDLNAYTGFDETVYILPVPTDQEGKLDSAFMILSDWSGGALLAAAEIDKERGVILAESRIGKGASDRMMKQWLPKMLNGSKYAERLPIGKDSIIEHFDHSTLRRYYHDWYRPDNQAVVVVGDMPVDKAENLIKKYFSDYKGPVVKRPRPTDFGVKPYDKSSAIVVSDPEASETSISIMGNARKANVLKTGADYYDELIERIGNTIINNRLNELRVSANPPFVYGYSYLGSFVRGYENYNLGAMCGNEQMKSAVQALVTEAMRAYRFGFTQAELERAKAAVLTSLENKYKERDKMESGRLTYEMFSNFFMGAAFPSAEWEYNFASANVPGITLESMKSYISKIDIEKTYFAMINARTDPGLPTNEQLKQWIDEALKADVQPYTEANLASSLLEKEPVAGSIIKTERNEKLGTITYTLSNNTKVCLKPTDFKNDEIIFKGSRYGGFSLYDGADYQSAQFSNNVVEDMGYGTFSSVDLGKFLMGKRVSVMPVIAEYEEWMEGSSTINDLETMFRLLYLKSTSPRKDKDAFQSYVSRSKQNMESIKQDPQMLFIDSAYFELFQHHKLAHRFPAPAEYDKMNMDNAVAYYSERLGNAYGMYYTFVGSFTEDQIKPLIEKYIGGLPSKELNTTYRDFGMEPKPGINNFSLRKGSEQQAMLIIFYTGKHQFSPKTNFRLDMLNEVANNKVTQRIREKMSAIYGGGINGSIMRVPREEYRLQAYFPCGPDNIQSIDTAFAAIMTDLRKPGGITETDLKEVTEPAIKHNQVKLKENQYWRDKLLSAHMNNLNAEETILQKEEWIKELRVIDLTKTAAAFYASPNVFKAEWLPALIN